MIKKILPTIFALIFSSSLAGQELPTEDSLEIRKIHKYIYALSFRGSAGAVIQGKDFFKGRNEKGEAINTALSAHLKYSFQFRPGTWEDKIYGAPYQGVGISYNTFFNRRELGNPVAVYLFQGARLARISPRLALDYEWNLGLSLGWKPFDENTNPYNDVVGSRLNAYINAGVFLNWMVSEKIDLTLGVSGSHYSNGNTKTPNGGVNMLSADVGLRYNFNREFAKTHLKTSERREGIAEFPKHMEHEFLFYGSWRRTTIDTAGTRINNPYLRKKFAVFGFSYAPMYALGYKVRVGVSVDFHYDQGVGIKYYEQAGLVQLSDVPFKNQLFLGLAGRVDYIMPYFTLAATVGYDVLHPNTNYKEFYQTISLKINLSKDIFFNVGYRLSSFQNPNFLMLGAGFRLNSYR